MSVRAPVGPVNFAVTNICIGRGLAAIRTSSAVNKEFLFHFLLLHENEIVGNSGAVFNSISKVQIESITLPLPTLTEQHRIVAILDEAFAAINKAKENVEKNLENSHELFESFLSKIFAKPGDGWEVCKIEDYIKFIDYRGRTPEKTTTGLRLITAKNVKNGFLQTSPEEFVDRAIYNSWMTQGDTRNG